MKYDIEITSTIGYSNASPSYVGYKLAQFPKGQKVAVRICSYGGSFFAGLELNRLFREHGNVTVYVTSYAASAATIAAMGAKKIIMDKFSCFLIHGVSQFILSWGQKNAKQIRDEIAKLKSCAEDNEKLDKMLVDMYTAKTGQSKENIRKILDKGAWLSPDECVGHKLVDEIVELGSSTVPSIQDEIQNAGLPKLPEFVRMPELFENKSDDDSKSETPPADSTPPGDDSSKDAQLSDTTPPAGEPNNDDNNAITPNRAVEFFNTFMRFFTPKNNSTINIAMHKEWTYVNQLLGVDGLDLKENSVTLTKEQLEKINQALKPLDTEKSNATDETSTVNSLEKEIQNLKEQVSNLQAAPGGDTEEPQAGGSNKSTEENFSLDELNSLTKLD